MSNCVYAKDLDEELDRDELKKCLEHAISQIEKGHDTIEILIGNVDLTIDYNIKELYIIV